MRDYEREIIQALLSQVGQPKIELPEDDTDIEIEHTGVGYYVTYKDPSIPKERVVLNKLKISGHLGDINVGFAGLMENSEFTLECYAFEENVTLDCRDNEFIPSAT